ncbi:Cullin-associated NEDD8-dissociated protein 1 [Datura stramonium]|uniref:Cullin-associated NEDD8-dissociated protein 1 n=1 Tax=Datura stramonium TaxID=4076 RepID=A0ABS8UYI9_DATST|nr:Cullin-associated NEDD8-dissociated protein 1 [Datura stramonium]
MEFDCREEATNKLIIHRIIPGVSSFFRCFYGKAFAFMLADRRKIRVPAQGNPFSLMRMWAKKPCGLILSKTFLSLTFPQGSKTTGFEMIEIGINGGIWEKPRSVTQIAPSDIVHYALAKQHLLMFRGNWKKEGFGSHAHIENIVIESFHPFEEIKSAASYALGNIAVGNLPKYLPFILDKIDNQQKKQYLLLHSLKEVIVRQSVDNAEFQDSSHVRRAAVLALSTAAHNKPNLIKGLLPELLPLLYDQTIIKKELIRTVDLGPFKHTVDDGLELRKAAFECVDTLLDTCLDQEGIPHLSLFHIFNLVWMIIGDVKMPCHLILSKLADKCPSAVLAGIDAVKQEVDRNEDMIRSALRAIAALNRISGGDYSHKFKNLMGEIGSQHCGRSIVLSGMSDTPILHAP